MIYANWKASISCSVSAVDGKVNCLQARQPVSVHRATRRLWRSPNRMLLSPRRHQAVHSNSPEPYLIEQSMNPYLNPRKIARGFRQAALMEWEQSEDKNPETLKRKLQDAHKEAKREIERRFGRNAAQRCQKENELNSDS
ncbi:MAG: hypothetical protein KatS3mg087_1743 [Patescibacteria group bacterium]|nr:MAG: hypothetical protein KatS3mg087_1743 [Patescibacteria group bacterium]